MKIEMFKKLAEIKKEKEINELRVNDYFLYGANIINQKENKKAGDPITYYVIINIIDKHVEYMPIYDYLEN